MPRIYLAWGIALLLSGCGMVKDRADSAALTAGGGVIVKDPALHDQALALLSSKCASCHTNTSSFSAVISSGWVTAGSSSQSRLYQRVADVSMPPSGGLSPSEIDLLKRWIDTGIAPGDTGAQTGPGSAPAPALEPTFRSISARILEAKCVSCHGASRAEEGIRYDSYSATLRTVRAGSAAESKLYKEVEGGQMPPSPLADLSAGEIQTIRAWIDGGALDN